jgi:trk system potassium uptake protein TrkH
LRKGSETKKGGKVEATLVIAALKVVGYGLGTIGPTGNFGGFSGFSKLVLSFGMVAGRLEIMPLILLFAPSTWRA